MAKSITLKQLIRATYLKIIFQFLICICLFYIIPALFTAVEGINANNVNSFTMFFSVSSWIYLCVIFYHLSSISRYLMKNSLSSIVKLRKLSFFELKFSVKSVH